MCRTIVYRHFRNGYVLSIAATRSRKRGGSRSLNHDKREFVADVKVATMIDYKTPVAIVKRMVNIGALLITNLMQKKMNYLKK